MPLTTFQPELARLPEVETRAQWLARRRAELAEREPEAVTSEREAASEKAYDIVTGRIKEADHDT
jgi:hypothetical protein